MTTAIRLLQIEDSEDDAELVVRSLVRAGFEVTARRVQSDAELREALAQSWDLIISDFSMPGFDGLAALALVRKRDPDIPFVFVSGVLGEERAVEAMRVGASDYVLKGKLDRLPAVVARELADARNHKRRQELEAQVRVAQRMEAVGRLAGGVAHDFNNVLTVIGSYTGFLLEALHDRPQLQADVRVIQDAAQRAAGLTAQLLAFSRKQVASLEVVDINALVQELERMLRSLIGEDVAIVCELGANLGMIEVDPTHVEQIIMNLAVNARDAMPQGGRLALSTRNLTIDEADAYGRGGEVEAGAYVALEVRDDGCGMDPETQLQIFEPFFTTKMVGQGTGLGLSTVYGIVKQARGFVSVDSTLGEGTTFTVCFPRVDAAPTPRPDQGADDPVSTTGSATVLLVEDEEFVRRGTRRMLERHGYRVLEAGDGVQALAICRDHAGVIDALVTDIVMPAMNGRQLVQRARELRPGLAVLYMSGYTSDVVIHHGVLDAGVSYLQKPFTRDALLEKLAEVLGAD